MKHHSQKQLLICALSVLWLSAGLVSFNWLGAQAATHGRASAAKLGLRAAAPTATSQVTRPATAGKTAAPLAVFATFTVDSISDAGDANPGNGVCATSGGVCTLRAAIQEANALGGANTINFSITGTITLVGSLPTITTDLTINGPGPKAGNLIIQGNNTFLLMRANGAGVDLTLSLLSFTQGRPNASNAGALEFTSAGVLSVTDCEFYNNQGIQVNGDFVIYASNSTGVTLNRCTVRNNATSGIKNDLAPLTVTTSTFSDNNGTAIYNISQGTSVSNSTIANHVVGIWNDASVQAVSATITNNLLSNNGNLNLRKAPTTFSNIFTSGGHNLIDDDKGSLFDNTGPGDILNADSTQVQAKLGAIADNGGPTQTRALITGSLALDVGGPASTPNTDQRGLMRPFNTAREIGAFEYVIDMTPTSLPSGLQNMAYSSTTLTGSNGTAVYSFAITSGSLPNGMILSSAGLLSGTPTQTGSFPLVITATDANGFTGSRSYTLTIAAGTAPAITSANSTTFTVGTAGSFTVTATGTPAPTLSQSGTLPNGVTFNTATGVLSGTPAAGTGGTYNLSFTASNGVNPNATQNFTLTVNTTPTISPAAVSRQQGNQPINLPIATVLDAEDTEETLLVTIAGGSSATSNGVTINNLTVNATGQVRADLTVTCTATNASFALAVTDSRGATANATLNVTVPANTAPAVGNYPDSTVVTGGALTITPDVPPTDNNTVVSVTAVATPNSFTGSFSGNTSSGGVTVMNANPPGSYTITVTLTDNCGATTTRGFMLTVSACGAVLSKQRELFTAQGGTDSFTVTIDGACSWTAVSDNPAWITVTAPVGGFAGAGTVSYSVANNPNGTRRTGSITVAGQTFRVWQGALFNDVPLSHAFYSQIGKLSALAITLGCGVGFYCPDANTTREQMAAFLSRAVGVSNPPVPGAQRFADVPPTNPFYAFIEEIAVRQITAGCGGGNYCPGASVTREQMAAFIIRALHAPGYVPPPPAMQRFADVPPSNPFYAHIEEMATRGITLGCASTPPQYCPAAFVTRGQMAAFLMRAFGM